MHPYISLIPPQTVRIKSLSEPLRKLYFDFQSITWRLAHLLKIKINQGEISDKGLEDYLVGRGYFSVFVLPRYKSWWVLQVYLVKDGHNIYIIKEQIIQMLQM